MRLPFSLFLALKYLKPKRSLISVVGILSVFGIMLGVAAVIIVISVFNGFGEMWNEKLLGFNAHVQVMAPYGHLPEEGTLLTDIETREEVVGVSPVISTLALVKHGAEMEYVYVLGVHPDRLGQITSVETNITGTLDLWNDDVVLGAVLARSLRAGVGDRVLVYSSRNLSEGGELVLPAEPSVSGTFSIGSYEPESRFVIGSLDFARELTGMEEGVQYYHLAIKDPLNPRPFARRLQAELGDGYVVRTWMDIPENATFLQALAFEKKSMAIILLIITFVATFCVTATLITVVYQKTREIGILKSVGYSAWQIAQVFVIYGNIMCLFGISLGVAVGMLILRFRNGLAGVFQMEMFDPSVYGFYEIPARVDLGSLAGLLVLVYALCLLSTLVPAIRAATMDPVDALKG